MRFYLAFFVTLLLLAVTAVEYRSLDGSGNNKQNPDWGKSGSNYRRTLPTTYADSIGAIRTDLYSTRNISNLVFGRTLINPANVLPRSDMLTFIGQFLAHDITLTQIGTEREPIEVPKGDAWFDPLNNGSLPSRWLRFTRALYDSNSGTSSENPRQIINFQSSWVDGSQIYGNTLERANKLRLFQKGKLLTSGQLDGRDMLPYNTMGLDNANDARVVPDNQLFVAGDIRANENPVLASLQTIFMREHNRICDILAQNNTSWDDETLYQEARKRVIAYWQNIVFTEYVPIILGTTLPKWKTYKPELNPSIDVNFVTGAFRYGHSEVNSFLLRLDEERKEILERHILLREGFFNPSWAAVGTDPLLRGAADQRQQQVDTVYVNDLRNFLFGRTFESGAMDLVAINIQRSRDFGAATLNQVRKYYNLTVYTDFSQITSDVTLQQMLRTAYNNNIENVEFYVGGLAEDHQGVANVGPTFVAVIRDQYTILRDADRFYFKNADAGFSTNEIKEIENTKLADIILRNTNITALPCSVFYVSDEYDCSKNPPSPSQQTSASFLNGNLRVSWQMDTAKTFITFKLESVLPVWIAIGFSKSSSNSMLNSDVIAVTIDENRKIQVHDYNIATDKAYGCPGGVCLDTQMGGTDDVYDAEGVITDGKMTVTFKRKLNTGDALDKVLQDAPTYVLYAMGDRPTLYNHGANKGISIINFFAGRVENGYDTSNMVYAHGVIMFLAWGVSLVFGSFVARYLKGVIGKFWLQAHLFFQIGGLAMVLIAFVLAIALVEFKGGKHFDGIHQIFGLITIILGVLQTGLGEFTNMAREAAKNQIIKLVFAILHWFVGYMSLISAFITLFLGLKLIQANTGYFIALTIWLLVIITAFVLAQIIYTVANRKFVKANRSADRIESIDGQTEKSKLIQ